MKTYTILAIPYLACILYFGTIFFSLLYQGSRLTDDAMKYGNSLLNENIKVVKINGAKAEAYISKGKPAIYAGWIYEKKALRISGDTLYVDGNYMSNSVINMSFPAVKSVIAERSGRVMFENDTIKSPCHE